MGFFLGAVFLGAVFLGAGFSLGGAFSLGFVAGAFFLIVALFLGADFLGSALGVVFFFWTEGSVTFFYEGVVDFFWEGVVFLGAVIFFFEPGRGLIFILSLGL